MKYILTTFALAGLTLLFADAATITPDEALARLGKSPMKSVAAKGKTSPRLVHTAKTKSGKPIVYIFNKGENAGYLVLSADDAAYPVLGYSDNGSFDAADIPPQMEWWISEYGHQIEYASERKVSPLAASLLQATRASREPIAPMIKTKWDQGAPYNQQCPSANTMRCYTGCVATSMAQVMNYWQYPEIGTGSISYNSPSIAKKLSLNFANRKFDWENMSDTYLDGQYTQEEANAVAYLMKAAGYSVKMDYSTDSSGALAMYISNGLKKYFQYDQNIDYQLRLSHSASEWEQLIYDNLKNVGPILYGGGSMIGGGHSFICDGYDGNGLFHFNWGWSGMSDGYFSLDALAPSALGSGGGDGGGYNFTQDAVLGIQPPTGKPAEERPIVLTQMGSLTAEIANDSIKFELFGEEGAMWVNYNPRTLNLKFGAIIEPQGSTEGNTLYRTISPAKVEIEPGYGTSPTLIKAGIPLKDCVLTDGTYKVTMATCPSDAETDTWTPVATGYGYYNYVAVTKKGETYAIDDKPIVIPDLLECEITNTLYYGGLAKTRVKISNDSDLELSKGYAPALIYNNSIYFLGESTFITVPPHSEIEKTWTSPLYAMQQNIGISKDTEFELAIFDESTYNFFRAADGNPVMMHVNPGVPQVSALNISMKAPSATETLPNGATTQVYLINDPYDFNVSCMVRLTKGVFCYNALACVVKPDFTGGAEQVEILTMSGMPLFMDSEGLRSRFNASISFPMAKAGEYYAVMMAYQYGSNYAGMSGNPAYFRLNTSGLEDVADDLHNTDKSGEIFNLQGMPVGADLNTLPTGMYIRNGKKILKK